MLFLTNLYHRILGSHSVDAIFGDFHKIVSRLEALAVRKEAQAAAFYDLHEKHGIIADAHLDSAIDAKDSADEALKAAAKIAALVS